MHFFAGLAQLLTIANPLKKRQNSFSGVGQPNFFGGGGDPSGSFSNGRGFPPNSFGSTGPLGQNGFGGRRGSTRNDIVFGECRSVTIIYAKASVEVEGNVGSGIGPQFFQAVDNNIGQQDLAVQGVNYGAGGPAAGSGADYVAVREMVQMVRKVKSECSETRIVLSGHYQGCSVVHQAAEELSSEEVSSVVLFADPNSGQPVGNIPNDRVQAFCDQGGSGNMCPAEGGQGQFQYSSTMEAEKAAQFVSRWASVSQTQEKKKRNRKRQNDVAMKEAKVARK